MHSIMTTAMIMEIALPNMEDGEREEMERRQHEILELGGYRR